MEKDNLIELIRSLKKDRNSSSLLQLMDWCRKRSLSEVTQEEAEIFYILYEHIMKG